MGRFTEILKKEGAGLAVIKSEDENRFVYDLLRNTSGPRHGWIGLYRKADDKFYWLDGRPVNASGSCQNWNDRQPSNTGGNEDCGLFWGDRNGTWNDRSCSRSGPAAICQWPI